MASVYILYSKELNKYYIGSCLVLDERLVQHQNKTFSNSFTSKASDWTLFYSISDLNYTQARAIESHIKKMKSRTYIENLKRFSEISQKLTEKYS
jgi:putative endonuclease